MPHHKNCIRDKQCPFCAVKRTLKDEDPATGQGQRRSTVTFWPAGSQEPLPSRSEQARHPINGSSLRAAESFPKADAGRRCRQWKVLADGVRWSGDETCPTHGDHRDRRVRVTTDQSRHRRGVGDPQAFNAAHSQTRREDTQIVHAHPATPCRGINILDRFNEPGLFRFRAHAGRSRSNLYSGFLNQRIGARDASRHIDTKRHDVAIGAFRE